MTELELIIDQIRRAYDGDPWASPSLVSILDGVTAERAAIRPAGLAHSIGDIVLHLAAWYGAVHARLDGRPIALPDEGEWPPFSATSWPAALSLLSARHDSLLTLLSTLPSSRLPTFLGPYRDPATGSGVTVSHTLLGLAQHTLYHAGQIALIKRLTIHSDD